jgi:hypothetical protein
LERHRSVRGAVLESRAEAAGAGNLEGDSVELLDLEELRHDGA